MIKFATFNISKYFIFKCFVNTESSCPSLRTLFFNDWSYFIKVLKVQNEIEVNGFNYNLCVL